MEYRSLIPFILLLAIIGLIIFAVNYLVKTVNRKVRRFKSGFSLGTASMLLSTAAKHIDQSAEDTPLTLSTLESFYLPKIRQNYPDLNIEDLRGKAGLVLKAYLDSVKGTKPSALLMQHAAASLYESVSFVSGAQYQNRPFTLHKAVISGFEQNKIKFEIAYKSDRQRKAEVVFSYMLEQDANTPDMLEKKCTNCGAILSKDAQAVGHCLYCDQVFKIINLYEWLAVTIAIH